MLVESSDRSRGETEYGGSSGGLEVLALKWSSLEDDDDGTALPTNARRRPDMTLTKAGKSGEKVFDFFCSCDAGAA
jgi:hypothetical protein